MKDISKFASLMEKSMNDYLNESQKVSKYIMYYFNIFQIIKILI